MGSWLLRLAKGLNVVPDEVNLLLKIPALRMEAPNWPRPNRPSASFLSTSLLSVGLNTLLRLLNQESERKEQDY